MGQPRTAIVGGRLRRRAGMTLIEVMVTAVILVVVILAVSMIMRDTQKLVKTSQAHMRANNKASAVGNIIAEDLRRCGKLGFLCIDNTNGSGMPVLLMSTAGPSYSLTGGMIGNGAIVQIGQAKDEIVPTPAGVIWRTAWVMNSGAGWDPKQDSVKSDLAMYQLGSSDPVAVSSAIDYFLNTFNLLTKPTPAVLKVHQANLSLDDINNDAWKVLCPSVSGSLTIEWTDGSDTGGNLNWYGPTNPSGKPCESPTGGYRATWTGDKPNDWPVAIRIRFSVQDESFPEEFQNIPYELVCPVGQ